MFDNNLEHDLINEYMDRHHQEAEHDELVRMARRHRDMRETRREAMFANLDSALVSIYGIFDRLINKPVAEPIPVKTALKLCRCIQLRSQRHNRCMACLGDDPDGFPTKLVAADGYRGCKFVNLEYQRLLRD